MAYDRFLIAPINTGLQTNMRAWMIQDDAFEQLENAYVFRGRVRKRFGSSLTGTGSTSSTTAPLHSRARIFLKNTDGAGAAAGNVPGSIFKVGQTFSIGDEIFTVNALGVPSVLLTTGASAVHTFNTATGAYIFAGATPATAVYFYPSEPIMGLTLYEEGAITQHDAYAFDTQFSYKYTGGSWLRVGSAVWHGSNSQFFWSTNWEGANTSDVYLFVTNYNAVKDGAPGATDDPIYSFDGTTWTAFNPKFIASGTGNYVQSCRIILPFKDRLLLLNTIEANNDVSANAHFPARCRYSHNGVPFPPSPLALAGGAGVGITDAAGDAAGIVPAGLGYVGQMFSIGDEVCTVVSGVGGAQVMTTTGASTTHTFNITTGAYNFVAAPINSQIYFFETGGSAWLEHNQPGWDGAGWIDATTDEEIISAEFIKDRLIVYFERSTWELAYTGNQVQPFIWQKINTELGADATFSVVPFDKIILTIGNVGIHACSGANVERIDTKIPDQIFDVRSDNNGIERICGIRDYYPEMVYWTFPEYGPASSTAIFPNKVLVYNYKNDSWALNDDCITTFGYFEQQDDLIWSEANFDWETTDYTWLSGITQADYRQVIAGNQQGFIFIIGADINRNAPVMQITDAIYAADLTTLTIENHTLNDGSYIYIENGFSDGGVDFELSGNIYPISVVDANHVSIGDVPLTLDYLGGSTATRVSEILIKSKQWNPYIDKALNVQINKIDFCVARTDYGEVTIDYSPSSSNISMVNDSQASGAIIGNNVLETSPYNPTIYPLESSQDRLWHPIYLQGVGECIQLFIHLSEDQIKDPNVMKSDFQLEGMILYTKPSDRLE